MTGKRGKDDWPFRGFCLYAPKRGDFDLFKRLVAEVLPEHGCNTLVLLIHYRYEFTSHPEVADDGALTAAEAAELARICRDVGIRIIPKMNLMGHQSGKGGKPPEGLLRAHPEFDETPDVEELRYCRSLCPRHPDLKPIVFDLGDELAAAFDADAIHVGLDEVFEIGLCPRCKGTPAAELFAEWVNALHEHFARKRGLEVLMWGDRLLDAAETGYSEWEASANATAASIDSIPKDILVCDWHYSARDDYPSVRILTGKGFRVAVCPWKDLEGTGALVDFAAANRTDRLAGVLATSWCDSAPVARYLLDGEGDPEDTPVLVAESFKRAMGG